MSAIRLFSQADIAAIAQIHAESFPRQRHSEEWIAANARSYPRARLYVASVERSLRGYVLELEQIAVALVHRNRGIGEALICQSLPLVAGELAMRSATVKAVLVSGACVGQ